MQNEATIARDTAIRNAEGGADVLFMNAADNAIRHAATLYREFTTDDVEPLCMVTADEPRAWGAAMKIAQASGIIEPTDRISKSQNKTSHRRPKRIWRSLIYGKPAAAAPPPVSLQPGAGLFGDEPKQSSYGRI